MYYFFPHWIEYFFWEDPFTNDFCGIFSVESSSFTYSHALNTSTWKLFKSSLFSCYQQQLSTFFTMTPLPFLTSATALHFWFLNIRLDLLICKRRTFLYKKLKKLTLQRFLKLLKIYQKEVLNHLHPGIPNVRGLRSLPLEVKKCFFLAHGCFFSRKNCWVPTSKK